MYSKLTDMADEFLDLDPETITDAQVEQPQTELVAQCCGNSGELSGQSED